MADGLNDVVDVVDRIRNTCVLSRALVVEVYLAVLGLVSSPPQVATLDVVLAPPLPLLAEVDVLCVAPAPEVDHAVVVPSVLVVADEQTLRVGRQSGLAGT